LEAQYHVASAAITSCKVDKLTIKRPEPDAVEVHLATPLMMSNEPLTFNATPKPETVPVSTPAVLSYDVVRFAAILISEQPGAEQEADRAIAASACKPPTLMIARPERETLNTFIILMGVGRACGGGGGGGL
jgi:hypothetical protein